MQPNINATSKEMEQKKHAVVSYENMSPELADAFALKYPRGLADYLPDVRKIDKPDGTSIYVVTVEIPSAVYLVKIKMNVDDIDDLNKWLDSEAGEDADEPEAPSEEGGEALPDDNIAQYGSGDDEPAE